MSIIARRGFGLTPRPFLGEQGVLRDVMGQLAWCIHVGHPLVIPPVNHTCARDELMWDVWTLTARRPMWVKESNREEVGCGWI